MGDGRKKHIEGVDHTEKLKRLVADMSEFKINELGSTLAYIVSMVEGVNYEFTLVSYHGYSWSRTGYNLNKGAIFAIVKRNLVKCDFVLETTKPTKNDVLTLEKSVFMFGNLYYGLYLEEKNEIALKDEIYNKGNEKIKFSDVDFENGPFPYLKKFIDVIAYYRINKGGRDIYENEIENLALEFIKEKCKYKRNTSEFVPTLNRK